MKTLKMLYKITGFVFMINSIISPYFLFHDLRGISSNIEFIDWLLIIFPFLLSTLTVVVLFWGARLISARKRLKLCKAFSVYLIFIVFPLGVYSWYTLQKPEIEEGFV